VEFIYGICRSAPSSVHLPLPLLTSPSLCSSVLPLFLHHSLCSSAPHSAPSLLPSVPLPLRLFICPSLCSSAHPSVHLPLPLFICLSLCFSLLPCIQLLVINWSICQGCIATLDKLLKHIIVLRQGGRLAREVDRYRG